VHAEDRPAAIEKMRRALAESAYLGVTTNLDFLQDLLAHAAFAAGRADTNFVERELADWAPEAELPQEALLAAGLLELPPNEPSADTEPGADLHSPWARRDGFRIGGPR